MRHGGSLLILRRPHKPSYPCNIYSTMIGTHIQTPISSICLQIPTPSPPPLLVHYSHISFPPQVIYTIQRQILEPTRETKPNYSANYPPFTITSSVKMVGHSRILSYLQCDVLTNSPGPNSTTTQSQLEIQQGY